MTAATSEVPAESWSDRALADAVYARGLCLSTSRGHGLRKPRAGTRTADPWFADHVVHGHHKDADLHADAACEGCPVRQECLEKALREESRGAEPYGVLGGLTHRRRQQLLVERGWVPPPKKKRPSAREP